MSVSAFAHGTTAAAGANNDTLALTALSSQDFDTSDPFDSTCGIRVLTNGNVEEIITDAWTAQNASTEWIDGFTTSSASDYEVNLSSVTGSGGTLSGPAVDTWHTISTTREWTLSSTVVGSPARSATLTIREILNTSNSVSASVTLSIENGDL